MKAKEIKISWFLKLLMKFWPNLAMRRLARKIGIKETVFEQAHEAFSKVRRIDLIPLQGGGYRGFMIILDRKTSLWFFQDGDHFVYDGYEMGQYGKGEVTVFDKVK